MADLVGKTLANQYQVIEFIGRGGMAEVYKVWDPNRMIYLAAKVLLKSLAMDKVFLRRFKREADSLAKLQHPNIVRYYGLYHDEQIAFMLLNFIDGPSLQEWIFTQKHTISPGMILQIARSVCGALHYAHSQGVVHCDIKPGNIMVDQNNNILLTDFGIARMTDAATATMIGFGTPAYMAPELVRGQDPSPQSDIYSFGIVLYEIVTNGERPFIGERAQTTGATSEKVRWEQLNLAPPSPRQYNQNISLQLEAVILRCLAKDPGMRFNSALDLLQSLELASVGKLSTQNWPRQTVRPFAVPHYEPTIQVNIKKPPLEHDRNQYKPPQKEKTYGIKVLIPLIAFTGLAVLALALVLTLGHDQRRTNSMEITQTADYSYNSPTIVSTKPLPSTQKSTSILVQSQTPITDAVSLATHTSSIIEIEPTRTNPDLPTTSAYITPTPRLYYPLSDCVPSHLMLGDSAFINYAGGKNNIRSEPDTNPSDNVIAVAQPGEVVRIIGGPVCNYGWLLWEVQTTRNEIGWTPETNGKDFWILPLTARQLCDGALPTRLVVGKKAKVNEEPPDANLIRLEPSRFDEVIGRIQPGDWMLVLEGPYCGEKANWWKIKALTSGIVGWTMEGNLEIYYLSPEP